MNSSEPGAPPSQETRHERRLGFCRRLLLVLPVVARVPPAQPHQTKATTASAGPSAQKKERERTRRLSRNFVDLPSYAAASARSSATILCAGPLSTFIPAVEVKTRRGMSVRSRRTGRLESRVPRSRINCRWSRRRGRRRDVPLRCRTPGATSVAVSWPSLTSHAAPDLDVHVDHVVVRARRRAAGSGEARAFNCAW